jgi:nitrogen fixation protein NifU and related proteins
MTPDIGTLYSDVVLDHRRRPRNYVALETEHRAEGANPLCGDRLTVFVRIEDGTIREAAFQGYGCAIAVASASLMTENVKGRSVTDAFALCDRFEQMITAPDDAPVPDLGDLRALAGVRQYPVRAKCAVLPWRAFRAAAAGSADVVSTEG